MFWLTLLMALREIRRNAMRSALTMLGMVIGVGAVITLVSVGQGATAQVTADIGKMGKNLLMVFPGTGQRRGGSVTQAPPFTMDDVAALQAVKGVAAVAPTANASRTVVYGNENASTSILGSTAAYLKVRDYTVDSGRLFNDAEMKAGTPVCLLGATVRTSLFGESEALGESVRVGHVSCRVVGLLASKGQSGPGMDQDDLVMMPITAFQRRIGGTTDVNSIYLSVADGEDSTDIKDRVANRLRDRRRIDAGVADNFTVRDQAEIVQAVTSATGTLTALLGAIAAVSLLVGGIGIMNIMLVSVTERTREIGIRIAIGALGSEVMLQFLVESVALSLLGGLIGVVMGLAGAYGASKGLGVPFVVAPETVVLAFVVSAAIGIVFGYLPARKAAGLEPIEALRHE
jgi:putative ABC transport system permease protein